MPRFQKALAQLMGQGEGEQRPDQQQRDGSGSVLSELRARVSTSELELVSPFAKVFLQNARLLEGFLPPSDLANLTLGACRFLCDRHTRPLTLRAYQPTVAEHGWTSELSVLEIATDNQPGLVTSICAVVEEQGGRIESILSAAVQVTRDETGLARSIQAGGDASDECLIHLQLGGAASLADLESSVRRHLEALGRTRTQTAPLQSELRDLIELLRTGADADRETAELLHWLLDGRVELFGFAELDAASGAARRLFGIYGDTPPAIETAAPASGATASLLKTRTVDLAHPGQFLDEIRIRPASSTGATYRIAGALTARAFREPSSGVPLAREVYKRVLEEMGDTAVGERFRRAFDELPLDTVLAADPTDVGALVRTIVAADQQPGLRVHVTPGPPVGPPTSFVTVIVPRQHLARSDADTVGQVVRDHVAPILARHFVSDELAVVRIHYTLDVDVARLRPELLEELTGQLRRALSSRRDAATAAGSSPPPRAVDREPPTSAAPGEDLPADIQIEPLDNTTNRFRVRIPGSATSRGMNELLASIDDLGLRILAVTTAANGCHEVAVEIDGSRPVDAARIGDMLRAMRGGAVEADGLSSLSWRAGLRAGEIDALRAFTALAESRGVTAPAAAQRALADNPGAAEAFLRAFEVKFDPRMPVANDAQRRRDAMAARAAFDAAVSVAGDRLARHNLRRLGELLDACVRTSFFCGGNQAAGRPTALKLRGSDRHPSSPHSEIFVHGPAFAGLVRRRGPAARPHLLLAPDPATLHAVAAADLVEQTLRCAKVSTDPGSAVLALRGTLGVDPDRALREFLLAVLDVVDDVGGGELVRNPAVVAYDEPDSYFSVSVGERPTGWAEVARDAIGQRGFWMGEAAVARCSDRVAADGAWAALGALRGGKGAGAAAAGGAVTEPPAPTVVAIGSPHELHLPDGVRLIAALDEHEIFIAPSIDTESSGKGMAELRRRGSSSWSDFPVDLRGRGGTVVRRDARKVELAEEARVLLEWTEGGGEELARAILAIGADLLWVRGASVRAVSRDEMSVGPSEHLEIEATRVGAASVAEVGHAFFSPAARVELALAGRIVHTPIVDSVAADVVADRICNIELALSLAGADRAVVEARSAEVAEEIRRVALDLPAREAIAIGVDMRRTREHWHSAATCIRSLRRQGVAAALDLPIGAEAEIEQRQGSAPGLTRPEIATLRAAVAVLLKRAVSVSALCRDPYLRPWIGEYFPPSISQQLPDLIDHHPLRDEIAALEVAQRVVEVMGFAFVADAAETHARPDIDIVKAWCAAFIFGGAQEVWGEIEACDLAPDSAERQQHRIALGAALQRATHRLIELRCVDLSLERMIDRFGGAVGEILRAWPEPLPESRQGEHAAAIESGMRAGLPRPVADHLARIAHLGDIVDVCDLAIQINSPRSTVATAFFGLDPIFNFAAVDAMARSVRHQDPVWGSRAETLLRARLAAARRALATEVVSSAAGRRRPVERWLDQHGEDTSAFQALLGEVKSRGFASSAAVEVLIGALEGLARGQRRAVR